MLHDHRCVSPSEDLIVMPAFSALIIGHIFDDAQDPYPKVLEHLYALDDIDEGKTLRGGNDDCSVEFQFLTETQLYITSSGGHVHDEEVQFTPVCLVDELGDDGGDDGSTHDGWLLPHESERHALNAFVVNGLDFLLVCLMRLQGLPLPVQESGQRGTVDIGVEDAHFKPLNFKCGCKVDSDCTLTDSSFAAGDGDDLLDAQ